MDLDEFVRQCEEAWQVFVTGDPDPALRLFSRRDDVTLANPWGPAATGWPEVSSTLEAAAARFRSGHLSAFDVRSEFVSEDVAWCHEVERGEAMLGGRSELEVFALRVTSIYRREDGQWRIVLRHADPIVVSRPPDATLTSHQRRKSVPDRWVSQQAPSRGSDLPRAPIRRTGSPQSESANVLRDEPSDT